MKTLISFEVSNVSSMSEPEYYFKAKYWNSDLAMECHVIYGPYASEGSATRNGVKRFETFVRKEEKPYQFRLPRLPYKRVLLR